MVNINGTLKGEVVHWMVELFDKDSDTVGLH